MHAQQHGIRRRATACVYSWSMRAHIVGARGHAQQAGMQQHVHQAGRQAGRHGRLDGANIASHMPLKNGSDMEELSATTGHNRR
jgi:hypothetical protein